MILVTVIQLEIFSMKWASLFFLNCILILHVCLFQIRWCMNCMFMYFCRLQKVLGLDSLDEVLDIKLVNSKHIVQNVYNVNKQGIVTLEDKSSEYFRYFNLIFFIVIY